MPYVNQLRWFFLLHFVVMNTFFCRCSNNKNEELKKKNKMLINVCKKEGKHGVLHVFITVPYGAAEGMTVFKGHDKVVLT